MPALRPVLALLTSLVLAPSAWGMQLDSHLNLDRLRPADATPVLDSERVAITDYLRANLGEPYRFGAAGGRQGFDCSGLVQRAYEAAGLEVPRLSREQMRAGEPVSLDDLRAGDLLFYRMQANAPQRLHVVVYVGEGRAIHASVTHRKVREIDITRDTWVKRLIAARTLL